MEILWTDEVGVAADHHPGTGYARQGERATMEVPQPHIRVNQISAISNEGSVRFMTYSGMLTAARNSCNFWATPGQRGASCWIADRLQAHARRWKCRPGWGSTRRRSSYLNFAGVHSPEMNPVEYLNNDMKATVNEAGLPENRSVLKTRVETFMNKLATVPSHVISYFLHPWAQYAAPVELL